MEQRCHLSMVWLTWLGIPALAALVGWTRGWALGVIVLVAGIIGMILYIRAFPSLSRSLGYGSVADESAELEGPVDASLEVTLYTANVCPFCPIMKKRLEALAAEMGFDFDEIDVSFRPQIVRAKGISSVPVVEVNGRFLVGNATSAELASFLREIPSSAVRTD